MKRRVEGSYLTAAEATAAIERLEAQGYTSDDILVVANSSVRSQIPYIADTTVTEDTSVMGASSAGSTGSDDRSMWEKIKDAFTVDEYDESAAGSSSYGAGDGNPLSAYTSDIENGNIIVLVPDAGPSGVARSTMDTTYVDTTHTTSDLGTTTADLHATERPVDLDDETIRLREERLNVGTTEVQTGEVHIGKRVTESTETVEVPVTHEEVVIERRPVSETEAVTGDSIIGTDEEIVIPVTEEQIQVSKDTVVTEEVDVRKETHTDTKKVTDTVRKETLDVDTDGNVELQNDDQLPPR